jgi:hypothetical protein
MARTAPVSEFSSIAGTAEWRLCLLETEVEVLRKAVTENHELSSLWDGTSPPFRLGDKSVSLAYLGTILEWAVLVAGTPSAARYPRLTAVTHDAKRLLASAERTAVPILALHKALGASASRSVRHLAHGLQQIVRAGGVITQKLSLAYGQSAALMGPGTPVHGTTQFASDIMATVFSDWFITFLEGFNGHMHTHLSHYTNFMSAGSQYV